MLEGFPFFLPVFFFFSDLTADSCKKGADYQLGRVLIPLDKFCKMILGTDHYFLTGEGGLEKFGINCLQRL